MIVYVESNFILHLALGEEQSPSAEKILQLVDEKKVTLKIPSLALCEPFGTITQRGRNRKELINKLHREIDKLAECSPHQPAIQAIRDAETILVNIETKEWELLEKTIKKILQDGTVLEITLEIFSRSIEFQEQFGLDHKDAIILATIVDDLKKQVTREKRMFISTNYKDFKFDPILGLLAEYECEYYETFELAYKEI